MHIHRKIRKNRTMNSSKCCRRYADEQYLNQTMECYWSYFPHPDNSMDCHIEFSKFCSIVKMLHKLESSYLDQLFYLFTYLFKARIFQDSNKRKTSWNCAVKARQSLFPSSYYSIFSTDTKREY